METICRQRIELRGIVQGVGFRPFVWRLARQLSLRGSVCNDSAGVVIEVQGPAATVAQFGLLVQSQSPPLAVVDRVTKQEVPLVAGETQFVILDSRQQPSESSPIPADLSVCDLCLQELFDPGNRRFRYPFINCTNCGPRFSLITDLPYDRDHTTMRRFEMCERCRAEYENPADRRFHAQPNACPACGPQVWFVEARSADPAEDRCQDAPSMVGDLAIRACQAALAAGRIVAVKGIGGFHLACDAGNESAVALLRERKGRVAKPFAVMVRDLSQGRRLAEVSATAARLLLSKERPIVLLPWRKDGQADRWSSQIAPGSPSVGLLLPYSPLHFLLLQDQPLVMTSANRAEEPIVSDNLQAWRSLHRLADAYLLHDRPIYAPCDDSVIRVTRSGPVPIRRSRGYAPLPLRLARSGPSVLAVGAELKAAFCVTKDDYAYVSPHVGEMENLETVEAFTRGVEHLLRLLRIEPTRVVADLHPDYVSSRWAREFAAARGLELLHVQHHHAHLASLLAEHRRSSDESLLGFVFDGAGYGLDGAIWGGEVFLWHETQFARVAHLNYWPLPGGEASIRHPCRAALALLHALGLPWDSRFPCVQACDDATRRILHRQLVRKLNCPLTSSMGRLFDAVASLLGVRQAVTYEAQAALELETLAASALACSPTPPPLREYRFSIEGSSLPLQIDPGSVIVPMCEDLLAGLPANRLAASFHRAVGRLIVELTDRLQDELARHGVRFQRIGLSGGVFQNLPLIEGTIAQLGATSACEVLVHRLVPPNDGGLALGQAWLAAAGLPPRAD